MTFGMRDGGPGGDQTDGARVRAADIDGSGAALGGDQKVAGPDPGPRQRRGGQPQDDIVAWMLVARREPVSEVGGGHSRRHEPRGLHADVAAGRQARAPE